MRGPMIRFGSDDRPTAWWEWPFAPLVWAVTIPLFFIAAALSVPYFTIYPDRHAHKYDFGTAGQRELMRRYRRFTSRVSLWRRCGRALAFLFRSSGRA